MLRIHAGYTVVIPRDLFLGSANCGGSCILMGEGYDDNTNSSHARWLAKISKDPDLIPLLFVFIATAGIFSQEEYHSLGSLD